MQQPLDEVLQKNKNLFRERALATLADFIAQNSKSFSLTHLNEKISSNLLSVLSSSNLNKKIVTKMFTTIGIFSPFKNEPIWYAKSNFFQTLMALFNNRLELTTPSYNLHSPSLMTYTPLYKKQSREDLSPTQLPPWEPDILLVPGLAFCINKNNRINRLGRGKGFFDCYLSNSKKKPLTIGVAFDIQVYSSIPMGPHDETLDCLVTSSEILGEFEELKKLNKNRKNRKE